MSMKKLVTILGILLIILGIGSFVYNGVTYTTQENVAQVGNVKITADTDKTVIFPPWMSGLILVIGGVLVVVGRRS
jgi:hypothetical protein